MAKLLNNQTDEQLAANTYFVDAEIIPNVYYQIYGFDKVFCHDDEGANYSFSTTASIIKIQTVTGVERNYYQVGALSLSEPVENQETAPKNAIMVETLPESVPENAKVGDVYCVEISEEETTTYSYKTVTAEFSENTLDIDDEHDYDIIRINFKGYIADNTTVPAGAKEGNVYCVVTEILDPTSDELDSAENAKPYEYNKYGKIKPNSKIYVTLELNETLKGKYQDATINIDGKDYDLGIDGTAIDFTMNKDHKIQINWVYGKVVETFRFICNR